MKKWIDQVETIFFLRAWLYFSPSLRWRCGTKLSKRRRWNGFFSLGKKEQRIEKGITGGRRRRSEHEPTRNETKCNSKHSADQINSQPIGEKFIVTSQHTSSPRSFWWTRFYDNGLFFLTNKKIRDDIKLVGVGIIIYGGTTYSIRCII